MRAGHRSVCPECHQPIEEDDDIVSSVIGWVHAECPGEPLSRLDLAPTDVVCGECFIVKPCGCDA